MTLSDARIAKYLNKNYYSIKFDAQHPDDITIGGKTYKNPNYVESNTCKRNGTHELAYAVATSQDGRLAFPTTVYFDENFNKLVAVPGFQKALDLEKILTYYRGDYHFKLEWNQFQQNFDQYQENL
ncbi:MAG: thioredoxin [Chitinophagales bacterium]|nr:thioredoxin [Chitinophagales bacterium]